jgi:hypothetical protein
MTCSDEENLFLLTAVVFALNKVAWEPMFRAQDYTTQQQQSVTRLTGILHTLLLHRLDILRFRVKWGEINVM